MVGLGLFNAEGVCCYGTNTNLEDYGASGSRATPRSSSRIDSLDLVEGTYKVDVAVHKLDGYPYDYHRLLYTFRVKSRTKDVGIYRPPHTVALLRRHQADEGVERRMNGSSGARLMDRESRRVRRGVRAAGRTVVFTNGVFDLLHPGHVRYLRRRRRSAMC